MRTEGALNHHIIHIQSLAREPQTRMVTESVCEYALLVVARVESEQNLKNDE